ncbi:MAG: ABC transporter ATP-binding protein, partial [Lachnospiraceae bacterium]|nr:ABC transporter ATP-binding protein [Lachnospiraceae bacterium]
MKIRLTDIEKSFAGKQVIRPVSITIESGSFTTLLGPSGCGKTTLLRMIAGLETPDAGEIWFDETCVFSKKEGIDLPPEKRGLGFVFQDFALWPHMTVFENVAFGLRARRQTDGLKERVERALAAVQLEEFAGRYPHQLSEGQQQRVAFARAIVIEPSCINTFVYIYSYNYAYYQIL